MSSEVEGTQWRKGRIKTSELVQGPPVISSELSAFAPLREKYPNPTVLTAD
jgi:hypothetical protein